VIGNLRIGALFDARASIVWMCATRIDVDLVFCASCRLTAASLCARSG
jgi:hypothetical protein